MKRLIIGLVVLSLLLGAGIGVSLMFGHAHRATATLLEAATESALAGDHGQAREHFETAKQRWDRYHRFTAAFSDHEPIEEIDGLFARLEIYAQLGDAGHFAALGAQLASLVTDLSQSHILRWWTLL